MMEVSQKFLRKIAAHENLQLARGNFPYLPPPHQVTPLTISKDFKYLGVILYEELMWKTFVENR